MNAQEVRTKWKKRESFDTRSRSGSDRTTTSGTENNITVNSREMRFITSISSNENERLVSLTSNEQNERCSLINSTPVDVDCIGKRHALKKYDQFALNTSCFWGKYRIKYYPSCAISRTFCH